MLDHHGVLLCHCTSGRRADGGRAADVSRLTMSTFILGQGSRVG